MAGSFISILPLLSFAILPDSIMADPSFIIARNRLFEILWLKSVILIEDDLLSIIVELSKYSIIRFDLSSVMISSFKYMSSYRFNNFFSLLSFIE